MEKSEMLCGDNVKLTAIAAADLALISSWYQDAGFLRLFDSTPAAPKTEKAVAQLIAEAQQAHDGFIFAIRLRESERIVGIFAFDGIAWTHGTAFVSVGIGNARDRGLGYGREAMVLALRFAFDELNLHRVCLTVFAYNQRAIALYESLGFTREGVYREHLLRDGKRHDMLLYGLLRREWAGAGDA
jgi:RimJ/RimL family protein N-acetyltransferase